MAVKKTDILVMGIVQTALRLKTLEYSEHALIRMDQREVTIFEVEEVIKYGSREAGLDEFDLRYKYWRYVIRNRNVNQRDIAISVDIEDSPIAVIVTVMLVDQLTGKNL
jgi:hypothetical protein